MASCIAYALTYFDFETAIQFSAILTRAYLNTEHYCPVDACIAELVSAPTNVLALVVGVETSSTMQAPTGQ